MFKRIYDFKGDNGLGGKSYPTHAYKLIGTNIVIHKRCGSISCFPGKWHASYIDGTRIPVESNSRNTREQVAKCARFLDFNMNK